MSKRKVGPTPGKRRTRRGKMLGDVVKVKPPVPGKHHLNFLKRLGEKKKKTARCLAKLNRRRNRK